MPSASSLPLPARVTLGPLHTSTPHCVQAAMATSPQTARRVGETGKCPSPDSASKMAQPPPAKRKALSPGGNTATACVLPCLIKLVTLRAEHYQ